MSSCAPGLEVHLPVSVPTALSFLKYATDAHITGRRDRTRDLRCNSQHTHFTVLLHSVNFLLYLIAQKVSDRLDAVFYFSVVSFSSVSNF